MEYAYATGAEISPDVDFLTLEFVTAASNAFTSCA
jgi:hypothetical protein